MGRLWSSHSAPLHEQLKGALRRLIASGTWSATRPLPGERHLASQFGVSRPTVRQALADLTAEGVLVRRQGSGTFVAPPRTDATVGQLLGFAEELRLLGHDPRIQVLRAGVEPADDELRRRLELPAADNLVVVVERLVSTGEGPVFLDLTALPAQIGRLLLGSGFEESIYGLLESLGFRLGQGRERLTAVAAGPRESELLGVAAGFPLLRVERVTCGDDGRPLESSLAFYRGDRYGFRVRLQRARP